MAPPTDSPRLSKLVPATVAHGACTLLADHLARLTLRLAPHAVLHLPPPEELHHTDLGLSVEALTVYAQTGEDGEAGAGAEAAAYARDRIQGLCEVLYSQAGVPHEFGAVPLDSTGDEFATALDVVLVAAWARVQLMDGEDMSLRELAALASLGVRGVRAAVESGELKALARKEEGKYLLVSAAEATRWLSGRGVKGLTE